MENPFKSISIKQNCGTCSRHCWQSTIVIGNQRIRFSLTQFRDIGIGVERSLGAELRIHVGNGTTDIQLRCIVGFDFSLGTLTIEIYWMKIFMSVSN